MYFIARFEDNPDSLHIRDAQYANHLAFLAEHSEHILAAGPLREDKDGPPVGALWLVEAPDLAAVITMLDDDPFWIHGLRAGRSVLQWTKTVPDHPVTI
jgi:hypothetical protein